MAKNITRSKQDNPVMNPLLSSLDRGIDDMEAQRELPIKEAFEKITELRNRRRDARS